MSYESRLIIPIHGSNLCDLYSKSGLLLAKAYRRVVIGARGPYIELDKNDLVKDSFFIPEDQKWRLKNQNAFYWECRSKIDNVKLYFQRKVVDYADYKINFYYISPFELYTDCNGKHVCIEKLKRSNI